MAIVASGISSSGAITGLNTTGANALIAFTNYFGSPGTFITDNKSNTWTALGVSTDPAFGGQCKMFYCVSPTVGTGHNFTNPQSKLIGVIAIDNADTAAFFDAQAGATTSGSANTSLSVGALTPGVSLNIVVSALTYYSDVNTLSSLAASGWTVPASNGSTPAAEGGGIAYKEQSSATAATCPWTWTGNGAAAARIASFKIVGSSASYNVQRSLLLGVG